MMEQDRQDILSRTKEDLENLEGYIQEFSVFLPLAVCTVNPSGIIIDINQSVKDLTGYDEAEVIGQNIESLFKDKKEAEKFFDQVLKTGRIKGREFVLLANNKKEIPVSVSAAARKDEKGDVIGTFFAISDISEIKKFQEGLEEKVKERTKELEDAKKALISMLEDTEEARSRIEEEQNKTRATLTSLTDGLIVFDKDKKISLVNPEAERILGLKEKEVLGKKINKVSGFPNLKKLYQTLGRKVEWTGQKYEMVLEKPIKRYFQISITPVVVKKETTGLMVIIHDITRGKEIERLKTEFVSIAAHQLRTPLSAIKWTLKMLLDGDIGNLTKEQVQFLSRGYQSNERMITLINDLLNVARIEEGRFVYDLTPQSLDDIIQEVVDGLAGIVKEKKIKLVYNKPEKPLPRIKADREKMSIVIQNLLDNAIRFNKSGGEVTISTKCDKVKIEITVKDTGIGIPKDQQGRIFDKFFRADNAVKAETEGTGLGLFIVKNIVEVHGGKVWFESKKGQGTTFWINLPVK